MLRMLAWSWRILRRTIAHFFSKRLWSYTVNKINDSRLQQIQLLQFTDRPAAEALLLDFVRETFPQLEATAIVLRPLAVSLNSFNGDLILASGEKLFFKTHVEPGSIIHEYYN